MSAFPRLLRAIAWPQRYQTLALFLLLAFGATALANTPASYTVHVITAYGNVSYKLGPFNSHAEAVAAMHGYNENTPYLTHDYTRVMTSGRTLEYYHIKPEMSVPGRWYYSLHPEIFAGDPLFDDENSVLEYWMDKNLNPKCGSDGQADDNGRSIMWVDAVEPVSNWPEEGEHNSCFGDILKENGYDYPLYNKEHRDYVVYNRQSASRSCSETMPAETAVRVCRQRYRECPPWATTFGDGYRYGERDMCFNNVLRAYIVSELKSFCTEQQGNPCLPATGGKIQTEVDFSIPGFTFKRHYRTFATDPDQSGFGTHWTHTFSERLYFDKASDAVIINSASGNHQRYKPVSADLYAGTRANGGLVYRETDTHGGNLWRLETADGTKTFDSEGKLVEVVGNDGQLTFLTYDSDNRLNYIDLPFGKSLVFAYNTDGLIASITLPDETVYAYEYEQFMLENRLFHRLGRIIFPDSKYREYRYEDQRHPTHLTGIVNELGNLYGSYAYDAHGRVVSSEHHNGKDRITLEYFDGYTIVTDALGRKKTYQLNLNNEFTEIVAVDDNGRLTAYARDAENRLSTMVDANGVSRDFQYDELGRTGMVVEAKGAPEERTTLTTWDDRFNKPDVVTEAGNETDYDYTTSGQLASVTITDTSAQPAVSRVTRYAYDAEGRLASVDGPREVNDVTTFEYHVGSHNLSRITNAAGHITEFTDYDEAGRLLTMIDPNGLVTRFAYWPRGWLKSVTRDDGEQTAITRFDYRPTGKLRKVRLPNGDYLKYKWNRNEQLVKMLDSDGNHVQYKYDAMGNRTATLTRDGAGTIHHRVKQVLDTLGRIDYRRHFIDSKTADTHYEYDTNDNLVSITDARGHATGMQYDALNRLVRQIDPASGVTEMRYDGHDNIASVVDPGGALTQYQYNGFGERTGLNSPDSGYTNIEYNANGNKVKAVDARGRVAQYRYDVLDRLTHILYPGDPRLDVYFGYDEGVNGTGRLTSMNDAAGLTRYRYDKRGNLIRQIRLVDGIETTIGYHYDLNERLVRMDYPSGRSVLFTQGQAGVMTVLLQDVDGTRRPLAKDITRKPFGPISSLTYGSGLVLNRSHDQSYRLIDQAVTGIVEDGYDYDRAGNITAWHDGLDPSRSQSYEYDPLSRVSAADGAYGSHHYEYDAVGNRTRLQVGDALAIDYGIAVNSNRLEWVDDGSRSQRHYDANGNTVETQTRRFEYDDDNRLGRFETMEGEMVAEYRYNGHGERMSKWVNGALIRFRYNSSGQLIGEYDSNGNALREYVYLDGQLLAMLDDVNAASESTLLQAVDVDEQWNTIELGQNARLPVVIAGTPTHSGGQPAVVGVRNVTGSTAEVAVREWEYLDGSHAVEQVSIFSMQPGRYHQADGSIWEVGTFQLQGTKAFSAVMFSEDFPARPKIYLTQQTTNDETVSVVRAKDVTASSFNAAIYHQESLTEVPHAQEMVGYLAVYSPTDQGSAVLNGVSLNYELASARIGRKWTSVGNHQLQYEEEKSADDEVGHVREDVDVLVLGGALFAQAVSIKEEDAGALRVKEAAVPANTYAGPASVTTSEYYLHTDHLGAVIRVSDQSGALAWDAIRDPFGNLVVTQSSIAMPLRFPGQYHDQESGLYYNYFRDYDPATGRYIQSDPIGLEGGLNTYAYVRGNPLRFIDPLGLHHGPRHGQMGHGPVGPPKTVSSINLLMGSTILSHSRNGLASAQTTGLGVGVYVQFCPEPPPPNECEDPSPEPDLMPDAASTTFRNLVGVGVNENGVCVSLGPVFSLPGVEWDTTHTHGR